MKNTIKIEVPIGYDDIQILTEIVESCSRKITWIFETSEESVEVTFIKDRAGG